MDEQEKKPGITLAKKEIKEKKLHQEKNPIDQPTNQPDIDS